VTALMIARTHSPVALVKVIEDVQHDPAHEMTRMQLQRGGLAPRFADEYP